MKNISARVKSIYHKMPACLRCLVSPARLITRLLSVLSLSLWIVAGEEISTRQKLAIMYAGHEAGKNYIAELAFGGSYTDNHIGRKWLWEIPRAIDESACDCPLVVAEVPRLLRPLLRRTKHVYVPCWVPGEIDVPSWDRLLLGNNSLKSDVCKIRKNKLHFEVTNRLSDLHDFYHNMYVPYLGRMHGNQSEIASYDFIKREFRKRGLFGDLLLIKKEEAYIAGMLVGARNGKAKLWYLGVRDGDLNYVQEGAIGALLYFSVCYLEAKGFTRIDFGASRPFLKDGVLRFKRKWNQSLFSECSVGFVITPLSWTDGVKGFFLNNPFIYEDETGLNGAVFVQGDGSLSARDFGRIYKDYYLNGLSKLVIYRFGEVDGNTLGAVPREYSCKMTICSVDTIL